MPFAPKLYMNQRKEESGQFQERGDAFAELYHLLW